MNKMNKDNKKMYLLVAIVAFFLGVIVSQGFNGNLSGEARSVINSGEGSDINPSFNSVFKFLKMTPINWQDPDWKQCTASNMGEVIFYERDNTDELCYCAGDPSSPYWQKVSDKGVCGPANP